jgi:type IV pilus assembly protein PilY1
LKNINIFRTVLGAAACWSLLGSAFGQATLADRPVLTTVSVPGNLALALSVEYPTAVSVAHIGSTYSSATEYLGYFDPNKCYLYNYSTTEADRHFYPTSITSNRQCSSGSKQWSGNFLNWATMQTIDPFRWALTGGYRVADTAGSGSTPGVTIIEKAWASGQGGTGNFPNRILSGAAVGQSTPVTFADFRMRIQGLGNKMRFTGTGDVNNAATAYDPSITPAEGTVYEVSVRVKVCDASVGLETNCVAYGSSPNFTHKPEGLLQKYANRIRYSAFGYLNDDSITRDGGVLRARMAFIGPVEPRPLLPSIPNVAPEWDSATGVMIQDPLGSCTATVCPPDDAQQTATNFGISLNNSGVMNYLNKFGQITPGGYKTYDPVGELYYAAVRYFKNLGNVPRWTDMGSATASQIATYVDGFPVITTWDDPILYSCQKNFILGIGDVNTHADKNVPGSSIAGGANELGAPSELATDPVNASAMTTKVGDMQGVGGGSLGTVNPYNGCCSNNSALMAGIAYDSHTRDIRPDVSTSPQTLGKQTIDTYWLDVLEFSNYKNNNQFYMAAKFGGFKVPAGFDPDSATALPSVASWYNTGRVSPTGQQLPDNYFIASDPKSMVDGLSSAFSNIAAAIEQTTTGAATSVPQVSSAGAVSYSASYKSADWSGEVVASKRIFGSTATPLEYWKFSEKLAAQLAGDGWKAPGTTGGNRVMVTWNSTSGSEGGLPFQATSLTAAQLAALDTTWRPGDDSTDFVNYLRGERTNESTVPNYRVRSSLVGDIVGSTLKAVGPPSFNYTDLYNPGYTAFKAAWANRVTALYVGTNAGVLHAINGTACSSTAAPNCGSATTVDAGAGKEIFAYVPSALFNGPTTPTATPSDNGLAALGNPSYVHKNFVNASPLDFDIDLANTVKGKSGGTPTTNRCLNSDTTKPTNWKTVLIGGLGKGGKSFYALDITDPLQTDASSPGLTESKQAAKVLWEFPRADDLANTSYSLKSKIGYSFGKPVVVKTKQHGWVVIFTSGYNNDGVGYFFVVDACTGLLVQAPISTGVGTATVEAGLTHPTAYVKNFRDGTADAVYAGDLLGNVWRLDVRKATGDFDPPERIALFKDALTNTVQPITTRVRVEYCPKTLDRFVMVGTGQLLDGTDIGITQRQNLYVFKDGTNDLFDTALTSANSVVRTDLVDVTSDLTSGTAVFTTGKGWFLELGPGGTSNAGWRMVNDTSYFNSGEQGIVVLAATLPDNSDVCAQSGLGLLYGINICDGKSVLRLTSSGSLVANMSLSGPALGGGDWWKNSGGNPVISVCSTNGTCVSPAPLPVPTVSTQRLNWREIPIAE